MGLLDSVLGQVLGGNALQPSQQPGQAGGIDMGSLAGALGGLLANNGSQGGLGGLVDKFGQAGLGDVIGSWIGHGQNAPISADQLSQVLGADTIGQIAAQLGLSHGEAAGQLSQMLPEVIHRLTPNGEVPSGGLGDDVGALLGQLTPR